MRAASSTVRTNAPSRGCRFAFKEPRLCELSLCDCEAAAAWPDPSCSASPASRGSKILCKIKAAQFGSTAFGWVALGGCIPQVWCCRIRGLILYRVGNKPAMVYSCLPLFSQSPRGFSFLWSLQPLPLSSARCTWGHHSIQSFLCLPKTGHFLENCGFPETHNSSLALPVIGKHNPEETA